MNDIDKDLMRKYVDILEDNEKQINESIQAGICDVIQKRLSKTLSMVENLAVSLSTDEGSEATVDALRVLIDKLQSAYGEVDAVRATYTDDTDASEISQPVDYPMADPTGTLK